MIPRYPLPYPIIAHLAGAFLSGARRSFRQDARECIALLDPPLVVRGPEHVPDDGPCVLTMNHYARKGFMAWWLALAVSAVMPVEVFWTMTAAWTYPGQPQGIVLRPLSREVLRRIARVYGFVRMPPMPPDPAEAQARAQAVRQVLAYARRAERPVIGLSPEGRDFPGGVLGWPAPGGGRFVAHLAELGLPIVPIAACEEDGAFCLRFGPAYELAVPAGAAPAERDHVAGWTVMSHIAALLPPRLRGEFDGNQPAPIPARSPSG